MKRLLPFAFYLIVFASAAQKPCDFSSDVTDSIGTYKSTREYAFHERIFGSSRAHIFFSLVKTDDLPTLNLTFITKSNDFIKANCLDKNSRIYFQLANGKVVTMVYGGDDSCGTVVRDQKGMNNRIQTAVFLFMRDSFQELKNSPITMMRIRFSTETIDYIVKSSFVSEADAKTYTPETYFMDNLHCILN
ncbi:hypothetical protein [Flavobacterium selenitireducens]|uniref:hypothetical protein n=1 Tax=Flavobacterium selenitireducens TaxID=2722704 RepID=UPI00168A71B3|nr:hypothetical protein [Flavobacterium selenitireducens]MBD3580943.1 hypothetical protein [Flavobacterium selenitireducens]